MRLHDADKGTRFPVQYPSPLLNGPERVLLIEDSPTDIHLLKDMLAGPDGDVPEIIVASRLIDALGLLVDISPDAILLDLYLPDSKGQATLQRMRAEAPTVPIVVVTGVDSEEDGLAALHNGAQDYLSKGQISGNMLRRAIRYAVERFRAERALRENEEYFRAMFEQAAVGMTYVAQDGRFLAVNQRLCDFLGYTRDELLAMTFDTVTHPDDVAADWANVNALLSGEQDSFSMDKRYIHKDGSIVWANINVSIVYTPTGQPRYFLGVVQDITARKKAEEASLHLAAIVEDSEDGIISKALDGTILSWNVGAERIYGYTAEEAIGRSISMLYPTGYDEEFERILDRIRDGLAISRLETKRKRKDGALIDIALSVSPLRNAAGEIIAASAVERDVTVLQWAESALRENEERLRQLTENVNQALWLHDIESGNPLYLSSAYAPMFGISVEQAYQQSFPNLDGVHPVDRPRVLEAFEAHPAGNFNEEFRIIHPDSGVRWIHIRTYPIMNDAGKVYRVAGVAEDITEHKQLIIAEREQRVLAEAMRDVANALNSTLDMSEVLDRLLDNIAYVIPHDAAEIMLIDGTTHETVHIVRSRGYADRGLQKELEALNFSVVGTPNLRYMNENKAPLIVPDAHQDGGQFLVPSEALFWRSYAGVPIIAQDEVIGFINLGSMRPGFFRPIHTEWLQGFAEQAAIAIRNAQLHEQAHELAAHQERQRLARDLHDAVSQTLFSATITAEALVRRWEKDPVSIGQGLRDLHHLTRGALAETRTVLLELRPETLAGIEFKDLIEQLVEAIRSRKRMTIDVQLDRSDDITSEVKLVLYRVTQEALNNIVKHAGASYVEIRLQRQETTVELSIRDNGSGFDPAVVKSTSMGLGIMRERAASIDAALNVDSTLGEGVRVTLCCQLPV